MTRDLDQILPMETSDLETRVEMKVYMQGPSGLRDKTGLTAESWETKFC